jgi:hypothetical protein
MMILCFTLSICHNINVLSILQYGGDRINTIKQRLLFQRCVSHICGSTSHAIWFWRCGTTSATGHGTIWKFCTTTTNTNGNSTSRCERYLILLSFSFVSSTHTVLRAHLYSVLRMKCVANVRSTAHSRWVSKMVPVQSESSGVQERFMTTTWNRPQKMELVVTKLEDAECEVHYRISFFLFMCKPVS